MNDKEKDEIGPEVFFADWIKTSMAFWESMTSMWPTVNPRHGLAEGVEVDHDQVDGRDLELR